MYCGGQNIGHFALNGRNRKVSELENVRIGKCQSWKFPELEIVRIGK